MALKRTVIGTLATVGLLLLLSALLFKDNIKRLHMAITLYDEDKIANNFVSMHESFNVTTLKPSSNPIALARDLSPIPDDLMIETPMFEQSINAFLNDSRTTGLMVVRGNTIVAEYFGETGAADKTHISFSVAKSFISALVGIAVEQGKIDNIDQAVTDYAPELAASGYRGVSIKQVLQMSSGVRFNEDYADFYSDINRFSRAIAFGTSLDDFTVSLQSERPAGTYHQYVSIDTQVLGMVLVRATGVPLTEYAQQYLWEPLGMQDTAYWLSDDDGMELALGGLNLTLRDYAKFGILYANGGKANGQQLVPQEWVKASVTPDAPHLLPGENPLSNSLHGYGYQWWIPQGAEDEFMAKGIYHQYIFVDPDADIVIVKTSANHRYNERQLQWSARHLALFRTLSEYYTTVPHNN